jgi:lipoprotein-releasing system permease protein
VTGTGLGLALGFGILAVRNEIVHGLTNLLQRQGTLQQFYQFADLPAHTLPRDLIVTTVAAIVISTLAGLLPAWRAAKLKPVEALRGE